MLLFLCPILKLIRIFRIFEDKLNIFGGYFRYFMYIWSLSEFLTQFWIFFSCSGLTLIVHLKTSSVFIDKNWVRS